MGRRSPLDAPLQARALWHTETELAELTDGAEQLLVLAVAAIREAERNGGKVSKGRRAELADAARLTGVGLGRERRVGERIRARAHAEIPPARGRSK